MLCVSLAVNLALAGGFGYVISSRSKPRGRPAWEPTTKPPSTNATLVLGKPGVIVEKQAFAWKEIESKDFQVYIANLRKIGCPELTIRDIIVAEINQLYAHKRATEVLTADQQWWKLERDPAINRASMEKMAALEQERRAMLAQLLGPDWEKSLTFGAIAPMGTVALNGPVLGALSAEAKRSVFDINSRSRDRLNAYYDAVAKEGRQPDAAEVARLKQESRAELAQVLDANQLEEYLLRYSDTAGQLRNDLQGVEVSPEEFRAMFRARDPFDQELARYEGGTDAGSVQRREDLEQQREAALKRALSPERFAAMKLNQDPDFQRAKETVQQYGGAAEAVLPLYEINAATDKELQRIRNDRSLTQQQQTDALEAIQATQQQSLRQILGDEAYQRYLRTKAP